MSISRPGGKKWKQAELGEPHSRFKLSWILVPLYFFVPKTLGWKNFWVQIIFLVQRLFESQKCKGQKTFCDKKLCFQKRFEFKNIWLQNISGPKYLGLLSANIMLAKKYCYPKKRFWSWKRISSKIFKCKRILVAGNILSKTSKIVTRTNVARANVTLTTESCLRWSHEFTFKI